MIELPHLETDVTLGCQNSCASCNHLVVPYRHAAGGPPRTTPAQVEHDVAHFAKVARTKGWAAIGGEPTMHRDLVDILAVVRASGIADKLELWTHGQTLRKQPPELWRAFDILVLSIYPGKHDAESLAWIERKCADEGLALVVKDERNAPNFHRLLEPVPTSPAATTEKFARCWFRTYSRVLNFGHVFQCCTSPHIPQLLQGREYGADGIAVEGLTEAALLAFLNRTEPLGSCVNCAGIGNGLSARVDWVEERDPARWVETSAGR